MKKSINSSVFLLSLVTLGGCSFQNIPSMTSSGNLTSSDNSSSSEKEVSEVVQGGDENHFLLFKANEKNIAQLLVLPTDTYETLEPYFPLVPNIDNGNDYYFGEWKFTEDNGVFVVYRKDVLIIEVRAIYTLITE